MTELCSIPLQDSGDDDSESEDESNKKNISDVKMKLLENAVEAAGRSWPHVQSTQGEILVLVANLIYAMLLASFY